MKTLTYAEALREALREEMHKDRMVFLIGEDVGQGYRGAFGVSTGLFEEFGPKQVIDTPICENSIIGAAIGASMLATGDRSQRKGGVGGDRRGGKSGTSGRQRRPRR